jgi:SAM-dependent methyltransferase
MTTSTYVYTNTSPHATTHHRHLSSILDPYTIRRLMALHTSLSGLSCLEVGAGAGSIATWLADRVGQTGRVVATDKNPMPIPRRDRLTVQCHDIVDEPVPKPLPYDVIHARLVLMHLPRRVEVLGRLARALARGGALVIEDFDQTWLAGRVLRAPSEADRRLFEDFHDSLLRVFAEAGVDPSWALNTVDAMVDAGLDNVHAEVHTRSWRGGESGCGLMAGSTVQLHDDLVRHGLTEQDLQRVRELMADRRMVIRMPALVSTVGWKR